MDSVAFIEHLSYLGVFAAMATSGYIVPLPEEIILLVGGYLIAGHIVNPYAMIAVSILGAIAGDTFIYYICHRGSRFALKLRARAEKKFHRYIGWFRAHEGKAIFTTRFILGMRFISPVISGLLNVPWYTFVFYNSLAALIFVPLVSAIGYFFHDHIDRALSLTMVLKHNVTLIIIVLVLGTVSLAFINRLVKKV